MLLFTIMNLTPSQHYSGYDKYEFDKVLPIYKHVAFFLIWKNIPIHKVLLA